MNNSVGYADPTRFENRVGLGTDGIGADMLEEFRIGYARLREFNVEESPETVWKMLDVNTALFPECRQDKVTWSYKEMDPWHLAFTSGVRPVQIEIDGKHIMRNGEFLDIDSAETGSLLIASQSQQVAAIDCFVEENCRDNRQHNED